MKKLLCAVLIVSLWLTTATIAGAAGLYAEDYTDVPSVMTQDAVLTLTAEPGGQVEVLQPDTQSAALLDALYDFVRTQGNRPVHFYDEATQQAIQALIPGVDIDSLYMTEFMGLQLSAEGGDAATMAMRMTLDEDYAPGQLIVAVLGIRGADDAYAWYPYRGSVPETGVICWAMPAEDYAALAQDRSVLHILTIRPGVSHSEAEPEQDPLSRIRPSKQADDLTQIDSWASTDGASIEDPFRIYFVDLTEPMEAEMLRLAAFLEDGQAAIGFFPEELRTQAQEMLQGSAAPEDMVIYDVAAVRAENYKDTYGDIATDSRFPTSYSADKAMFALLGFPAEDGTFQWHYLRTSGITETTNVEIVYKQLILPAMEKEPAMLIVFSEPLIEDETKE